MLNKHKKPESDHFWIDYYKNKANRAIDILLQYF